MTTAETLSEAPAITRGTTCLVMPVGDRFKVCRRIDGRVVQLGYRTDPAQLCTWLRKLTATNKEAV